MEDVAVEVSESSGSCRSRSYSGDRSRSRSRSRSPSHIVYESVHRDAISVGFRSWCPLCETKLRKGYFPDSEEAIKTAIRHVRDNHKSHGRKIMQRELCRRYEHVMKRGNDSTENCYFEVVCPDCGCSLPKLRKWIYSPHEAYRHLVDHMQENYEKHPSLNDPAMMEALKTIPNECIKKHPPRPAYGANECRATTIRQRPGEVFIGNIPMETKLSDFRHAISSSGLLFIRLHFDITCKVYAFATYTTEEDAQRAIQKINVLEMHGRRLTAHTSTRMLHQ